MEIQLIDIISNGGAFALSVFLVVYVMRSAADREKQSATMLMNYADRLEKLTLEMVKLTDTLERIERRIPLNHNPREINYEP